MCEEGGRRTDSSSRRREVWRLRGTAGCKRVTGLMLRIPNVRRKTNNTGRGDHNSGAGSGTQISEGRRLNKIRRGCCTQDQTVVSIVSGYVRDLRSTGRRSQVSSSWLPRRAFRWVRASGVTELQREVREGREGGRQVASAKVRVVGCRRRRRRRRCDASESGERSDRMRDAVVAVIGGKWLLGISLEGCVGRGLSRYPLDCALCCFAVLLPCRLGVKGR
jgi:hypothetical protein